MTPAELVAAAESKVRDAENNLATCVTALNDAKKRHGGVPNHEVLALAQTQAVLAQAYSSLAMAKTTITLVALAEPTPPTPDEQAATDA